MSWHYLQGQEAGFWEESSSAGIPDALSNLIPTAAESYSPDSGTGRCPGSPSGTTCRPSTGDRGEDQLTLSLGGSPAKTSARQVKVRDLPEAVADFGLRCSELLARCGLALSGRKTRRSCVLVDSAPLSKDLAAWGMTPGGACWELGTLVRHISESASGYWPTPAARNYGTNHGGGAGRTGKVEPSLETMARKGMWPTPTAGDSKSSGSRNTATSKAHPGISLTDAVRGDKGRGRKTKVGGQLNPTWVEWLMGWPLGWTDLRLSETDKSRKLPRWPSRFSRRG